MPTLIKPEKILKRETGTYYRGLPIVIELHPGYLTLRPKGKRRQVAVDYGAIMDLGYKMLARAAREEKIKTKQAKRQGLKKR